MNETNETEVPDGRMDNSFFLGLIPWQTLSPATPKHLFIYINSFIEGSFMIVGNFILVCAILAYKPLRRKEMYIMAGLAVGDFIYGLGYLFSGIRRTSLGIMGKHLWKVTPWHCMGALQNPLFIVGSQAAGLMLVMVSVDRLIAVKWFSSYMTMGTRYAKTVLVIVFGYSLLSMVGIVFLSGLATPEDLRVPAICLSTHVGPEWLSFYQPTVQLGCGLLSVLVYAITWHYYKKQTRAMPQRVRNQQLKRQRKLTRTVGITVLFTFFCYVIPHSMIFFFNTFPASKELAGLISPYGWAIGNINSFINIFILGVHNTNVRRVLKAWIRCKKPQFARGHTLTQTNPENLPENNEMTAKSQQGRGRIGHTASVNRRTGTEAVNSRTDARALNGAHLEPKK